MGLRTFLAFGLAALCEIAGCYTAWMWLKLGRSPLWLIPGVAALVLFALALSQVETAFAGRAFAAYGGVYIAASLVWAKAIEHRTPDLGDIFGGVLCLAGAFVILFGRST